MFDVIYKVLDFLLLQDVWGGRALWAVMPFEAEPGLSELGYIYGTFSCLNSLVTA